MYMERVACSDVTEAATGGEPARSRSATQRAVRRNPPRVERPHPDFEEAFQALVEGEGGLLMDPRGRSVAPSEAGNGADPSPAPEERLTPDRARPIYRLMFWTSTGCDHLPPAVALEVFDMAVSTGPVPAIRALQRALWLTPDGVLRPSVLRAAIWSNPVGLRARFVNERLAEIAGRLSLRGRSDALPERRASERA
ncbi:MAG: hypothetical protein IM650_01765 [Phenylobacterium sp.]|nr:glycosyl hydrolase 108 family protein [Phenylobacterium sp.]MCA6224232.1 hypothetical protein [Phenylobacterium sp.]MCA6231239.1 hypothetical protein [Phenylobacterium sp.]MCA6256807.1 hypothetical protein [Phenylobacterium sp.]MCA6280258.1 hypothetical protein [Phenylobacterium sp.]MCA6303083.1 hypothetical protein [Phenylobacterium sp.]